MPAYSPETTITDAADLEEGNPHSTNPSYSTRSDVEVPLLRESVDGDVVDALHSLCGIYTRPNLVKCLLDRVGWRSELDLSNARLLEPGAGDGAFLEEAVKRLVLSLVKHNRKLRISSLRNRILAFELAPREAEIAKGRIERVMQSMNVHHSTARACARAWVKIEDFLLAELPKRRFSHIVGNPPYLRWSKLPADLKNAYSQKLPSCVTRGDLLLPFLHKSFESLAKQGLCAFVCSDRWRYNAYAVEFNDHWRTALKIHTEPISNLREAFDRRVKVQAEILVAAHGFFPKSNSARRRRRRQTLRELGCTIRVGPALGVTQAFVLHSDEHDVEPELLHPWIDSREIQPGRICWGGRYVVSLFDKVGKLIELEDYPLLEHRLNRFKSRLRSRYIVRKGSEWYRTIEKVTPSKWAPPKLLIPEISKSPRIGLDRSGAIPAHSVYAIFHENDEVEEIYDRLKNGKLAEYLAPIAPSLGGGYIRCYRRFLERITL